MGSPGRVLAALSVVAVLGLGAGACGGISSQQTISVLGTWTGDEQERFADVLRPFERETGIHVRFDGTRDFEAVLAGRVQSGDAPDLALMPSLGDLEQYAHGGQLVALDDASGPVDLARIRREYGPTWLGVGEVPGADGRDRQYGLVVKGTRKSLVWYSSAHYSWPVPRTLDELLATSREIVATGTAPWCLGLRSSSDSGWPGTDWIEDILLHQASAEEYRSWANGELPWTSDTVLKAWTTWGELVAPAMVRGGTAGALLSGFGDPGTAMFDQQPGCYLQQAGSFAAGGYRDSAGRPAADARYFDFPATGGGDRRIVIAGDVLAMFHDTPAARRLANYLTGPQAQEIWARAGGTIAPNNAVAAADYPDDALRALARSVEDTACADVVFDASDAMPAAMRTAFYRGVTEFVANPASLDRILIGLDNVRLRSYPAAALGDSPPPEQLCPSGSG
ncbi:MULTISPECIES: ABC transporter substrate-binding protein [Pseudofrankia]|uniref:ABC transporter substrate-binding protein n=1 Tax=Pseudofrankia TaxID=2994363 RepID=UPI000234BE75|nr:MULTISPECIES: ABC transporter substrate-binding protein [Pseudofrankia]OHV33576.1 hypothetical protein BCD49_26450 [Pseudofrankia sp. EUN1h]